MHTTSRTRKVGGNRHTSCAAHRFPADMLGSKTIPLSTRARYIRNRGYSPGGDDARRSS